jgi:hypothetical protein
MQLPIRGCEVLTYMTNAREKDLEVKCKLNQTNQPLANCFTARRLGLPAQRKTYTFAHTTIMINATMMLLLLSLLIELFFVTLAIAIMFWSLFLVLYIWTPLDELVALHGLRWDDTREEILRLWRLVRNVCLVVHLMVLLETFLLRVCIDVCPLLWNMPDFCCRSAGLPRRRLRAQYAVKMQRVYAFGTLSNEGP